MNSNSSPILALPPRPGPASRQRRQPSQTLSFRVPDDLAAMVERAAVLEGLSVSDYLRHALVEHFDRTHSVTEDVRAVATSVGRVQDSLARAVEAILVGVTSGTKISSHDARAWVDKNLRTGSSVLP